MEKYILLLGIFLLSFSISIAQPLSIKWDHKFVEDSMGIGYIKVVSTLVDKEDKLFFQLENEWKIPAFLSFDPNGKRIFYQNRYFRKGDTSFFDKINILSKPMKSNLTITSERLDGSFYTVITLREANPNLNLSFLTEYSIPKNDQLGLYIVHPIAVEKDILYDPISILYYDPIEYIVFCNSKFTDSIVRVNTQGVIQKQYPLNRDLILRQQNIIQSIYEHQDSSKIWMLSGMRNTGHQILFPKDSLYGFQLRTFSVNRTNHTITEKEAIYYNETTLMHPERNFYPVRLVVGVDKLYVVGNSRLKEPLVTNLTDAKPFIATLDKNGKVSDCTVLDEPLLVNTLCMASGNSSILIGGSRIMKSDSLTYFYENAIIEFDFASKSQSEVSINRIPWASKRGSNVTSIDRYSNGDFSYTTWNDVSEDSSWETSSYVTIGRLTRTTTSAGDNQPRKTNVNVTPNPSTEMATVEFESSPEASTIQLVDIKGNVLRTLYQKTTHNTHQSSVTFRVSDLANGMYYVVVGNGTKTLETVPLSIQK
jgi:hypothetical protein